MVNYKKLSSIVVEFVRSLVISVLHSVEAGPPLFISRMLLRLAIPGRARQISHEDTAPLTTTTCLVFGFHSFIVPTSGSHDIEVV